MERVVAVAGSRLGSFRVVGRVLSALVVALAFSTSIVAVSHAASPTPGAVYAWFDNDAGQLGIGSYTNSQVPVPSQMPPGVTSTAVAAGQSHSVALTSTGTVYAWGRNGEGQLGNNSTVNTTVPVQVDLPAGVTITAIASGWDQTLAVTSTGALYAWGMNKYGELGDGTTKKRDVPVLVHLPAGVSVTAVAAGQYHSLAVTSTGAVYAWGDNATGQLGDNSTTNSTVPVLVTLPTGVKATAVGAGDSHSLVVTSTGAVYAWGKNTFGQLGDGGTNESNVPVLVALPAGIAATAVVAGGVSPTAKVPGGDYSLALTSTGTVYGWGGNGNGQLGNGGTSGSDVPVLTHLPVGVTASAIGAGPNYGHALTTDGGIYYWGADAGGHHQQLVPAPTPLPTGLHGDAVSAGPDGEQILAVMVPSAPVASLTLSPAASSIAAGGAQTYTATGYDASGKSLGDVTAATTFGITNGTCTGNSCTSSTVGNQTVTGTDGPAHGIATLTVNPGPTWSPQAIQPQAVTGAGAAATSLNGELWVAWHTLSNQVGYSAYDPGTATWSPQALQPQAVTRNAPGIAALNGKLYMAWTANNSELAISSYDPTTSAWTAATYNAQVVSTHDPALAVLNGQLWVAWATATDQIGYASYDPTTGVWSTPALQPQATTLHRPALAATGTNLYLDWQTPTHQLGFSSFDPTTSVWSSQTVQPQAASIRAGPTLTAASGLVYAAWTTHTGPVGYSSYDPSTSTWSPQSFHPQALADSGPAFTVVSGQLTLVWKVQGLNELGYSFLG
ncbi:MAG TPA: hypothetical protein VMV06_10250 [Acidimicrobiales bacterium]|nr:hypothetical protein [Acidimicrobiales bacterium]